MIRRVLRSAARKFKRLVRPLQLRWIKHQIEHSDAEILRLRAKREGMIELERIECHHQVRLAVRRIELELT